MWMIKAASLVWAGTAEKETQDAKAVKNVSKWLETYIGLGCQRRLNQWPLPMMFSALYL